MKKNNFFRLFCQALAWMILTASAEPLVIYVAPEGNDSGTGSIHQPFKSLEKARDTLRLAKASGGLPEGATVFLREGVYERESTFELDDRDSGTASAPVVYASYPGEQARLLGGRRLPASALRPVEDDAVLDRLVDQSVRAKLRTLDLKSWGITDCGQMLTSGGADFNLVTPPAPLELFIDGKAQILARYPNELSDIILNPELGKEKGVVSNVPQKAALEFVLDKDGKPESYRALTQNGAFAARAKHWKRAEEPLIGGCLVRDYAWITTRLASILPDESKGTVTLALAEPVPVWASYNQKHITRFQVMNLLEEIDRPGEYWLDRATGRLYLYPPAEMNSESELAVSLLEDVLIACENVSFVTFRGLTLEVTRSSGIYIERGEGVVVEDCEIRNTGLVGVQVGRGWENGATVARKCSSIRNQLLSPNYKENSSVDFLGGLRHRITACRIHGTGRGGVILGGGNRKTLEPAGNVVEHCEIYDVSRRQPLYSEQVLVHGVGNVVRHNRLVGNPGGILYWAGNDLLIEYNEITGGASFVCDGGVVETRQNPSFLGNVFRFNYLHDNGRKQGNPHALAIYLDNNTSGNLLQGNLLIRQAFRNTPPSWRGMISINGGVLNKVVNNFFFENTGGTLGDGQTPQEVRSRFTTLSNHLRKDVDVTVPPYSERYPEFAKTYAAIMAKDPELKLAAVVSKNVQLRSPTPFGPGRHGGREDNLEDATLDPRFIAPAQGNYHLRADSPVYKKLPGFERIPFELMGPLEQRRAIRPNLDQAEAIPVTSSFHWAPARLAASQELYLGTSRQEVEKGAAGTLQARLSVSEFTPKEPLRSSTTYYWRVATLDQDGQPLDKGQLWSFSTQ